MMLLLTLAVAPPADDQLAAQAQDAFRQAVQLRDEPDKARPLFRRSADLFEELRQRGAVNPALLRDEGNAYLLAGDLPGAILACRRGLRLAPNDRALQQLLAAAREEVIYPQPGTFARPPVELRPPWLPRLPLSSGLVLTSAIYSLGCLCLTRWWMLRRGPWLALGLAAIALTALLAAALLAEGLHQRQETANPIVVIAHDGVLLRRGNGAIWPRRYETPVNRGVEGRLLFDRGAWVQIELAGGEMGWVPRKDVLMDGP